MLTSTTSAFLRRAASASAYKSAAVVPSLSSIAVGGGQQQHHQQQLRWKSKDVGDVIGIDLGTTNSCVAIMVRLSLPPAKKTTTTDE
jgi:hypothetical protein